MSAGNSKNGALRDFQKRLRASCVTASWNESAMERWERLFTRRIGGSEGNWRSKFWLLLPSMPPPIILYWVVAMAGKWVRFSKGFLIPLGLSLLMPVLLPSPLAKLCIAPGSHRAIEELGSDCCASVRISAFAESHSQNRIEAGGTCGDCTDILIVVSRKETIPASQFALGAPAGEVVGNSLSPDITSSRSRYGTPGHTTWNAGCLPIPMRC